MNEVAVADVTEGQRFIELLWEIERQIDPSSSPEVGHCEVRAVQVDNWLSGLACQ